MKKFAVFLLCLFSSLYAERGIVVACNDKYAADLLPSLAYLRKELRCTLPIEVWHAGNELSERIQKKMSLYEPIVFKDIEKALGDFDNNYRGFQIKPYMMLASAFDEMILMDADVYFYQDPSALFENRSYQETGAYFFRDLRYWQFPKTHTKEQYHKRREFFRSLIAKPSAYFPQEWSHFWLDDIKFSPEHPLLEAFQESGCLAFNKAKHSAGLQMIVRLNRERAITYKYIYGDKETFWLGLEVAREPYTINRDFPLSLHCLKRAVHVVQVYEDELFYQQKSPIPVDRSAFFNEDLGRSKYERNGDRLITDQEMQKIMSVYSYYKSF